MLKKLIVVCLCVSLVSVRGANDDERITDTDHKSDPRPPDQPNPYASAPVPGDFKVIQDTLAEERKNNKKYDSTWKIAEKQFQQKKKDNPKLFKPGTPEECYIAVIAYTQGGKDPLYKDFNTKFRQLPKVDDNVWKGFPYKSFYWLLKKAVPGIQNNPNPNSQLFRGIKEWKYSTDPKAGDTFYFDYFASSSTDRAIAERFMKGDGTLVQIDGGAPVGIGISDYSRFDEKEVLIFPESKFKVKSLDKKDPKKHILVLEKA